jgi:hypothetical protein
LRNLRNARHVRQALPYDNARLRSIALITFIWAMLTCPLLAVRQAVPWSRKISATSNDGPDMAGYEDPALPVLRLVRFRSSSGLSTAAIIPVATRAYRAVVVSLECPMAV